VIKRKSCVCAGAVAGSYGVVAGAPLDVIAVRLQQPNTPYRGIWHCCSSLVRAEGPLALYKGMSSPLVTVAVQQSVCFQSFGFANRVLAARCTGDGSVWPLSQYARLYLAGAFAGAVQCLVTVPQERLKIKMQVRRPAHMLGMHHAGFHACPAS
jgi:solute carrier family 25 carnitine/acylcarnitine transporter 20/29